MGPSVSIKEKTPKSTKIRGRDGGDKGGGECGDNAGDASDVRVSGLVLQVMELASSILEKLPPPIDYEQCHKNIVQTTEGENMAPINVVLLQVTE